MSLRELRHDGPSGRFSKSRGLSTSISFLSSPPLPALLLAPFFARSLTLLLSPLFLAATASFPKSRVSYFRFARFNLWPVSSQITSTGKQVLLELRVTVEKIATRPETQITHTGVGRQSLAPVDINTRERKQREQETVSNPECE